jgi:valacyclovir hydrolase
VIILCPKASSATPFFKHNGQQLFYRCEGSGPLLIVLPGNTASSASHAAEITAFSRSYRVVALDPLGTGQSDRIAVWPDTWWEQNAHAAASLVVHLGYEGCIAMGTSGGGITALLLALVCPSRVRAVIADSCVERLPGNVLRAAVAERRQYSPAQVDFWRRAHGDDWQTVVDADSELLLRQADRQLNWFDGRLRAVTCPVLLTASLRDGALPNVTGQLCHMAEQIPNCQLFFTNAGGHPLMWSRPEAFQAIAWTFLHQLESSVGSGTAAYQL